LQAKSLGFENFFPRIYSKNINFDEAFSCEMEYYAYPNLFEFLIKDKTFSQKIAKKIKDTLNVWNDGPRLRESNYSYNQEMFVNKTEVEYKKLLKNRYFKELSKKKTLIINGEEYRNFSEIWSKIKELIENRLIKTPTNKFIHGDCCFSNILCGQNGDNIVLKFIDPRGSYGAKGCFGNRLYDLAKLMHSYEGKYEYIINDLFTLSSKNNSIKFSFINDFKLDEFFYVLFESQEQKENAKLIQGLVFIGMCARHFDSLNRQKIQYATGIKILNEFI
jgi:thiamine kinase-like enzyme